MATKPLNMRDVKIIHEAGGDGAAYEEVKRQLGIRLAAMRPMTVREFARQRRRYTLAVAAENLAWAHASEILKEVCGAVRVSTRFADNATKNDNGEAV